MSPAPRSAFKEAESPKTPPNTAEQAAGDTVCVVVWNVKKKVIEGFQEKSRRDANARHLVSVSRIPSVYESRGFKRAPSEQKKRVASTRPLITVALRLSSLRIPSPSLRRDFPSDFLSHNVVHEDLQADVVAPQEVVNIFGALTLLEEDERAKIHIVRQTWRRLLTLRIFATLYSPDYF
ncbi:hypothetical protein EYF80_025824 [Liparis tanakae]|uniref:Uncharacterized protein n=1 Tax=Liparis tanakae TaxID=230148 RepID=A0A4Z2HGM0_9TELE|nr:hypothetical protein EYF80_025824 [Liparis tanakae]